MSLGATPIRVLCVEEQATPGGIMASKDTTSAGPRGARNSRHGVAAGFDGSDFSPTPFTTITRYSGRAPAADRSTKRIGRTGASGVS